MTPQPNPLPWHLQQRPFEPAWDTRFFCPTASHTEALNRMHYHALERSMGICLITGDIGCGKSITRAVFTQSLGHDFVTVSLDNACFSFDDLLLAILRQLDPHSPGLAQPSRYERCEHICSLARGIQHQGRHLIILLDEAQDLHPSVLQELRMLTNLNYQGRALLSLILVGQPELRHHVEANLPMNQRVSMRYHLRPLREDEVPYYLTHRLLVAGHPEGKLFHPSAAELIHHISMGIPREINRFAKLSMEHAWVNNRPIIDAPSVQAIFRDYLAHVNVRSHQHVPLTTYAAA